MAALLPLLVSPALIAAACTGAGQATGEVSPAPATSTEPAPATTEPAATPPTTEPPPLPEPPATTRAAEDPAPPPAAEDPEPAPTVTGEAPAEPIHPPGTTLASEEPAPPPTTEPPDEDPAVGDSTAPTAGDSLPGEPYEYGPDEGTSPAIVGVPYQNMLTVHDVPSGEIIATLDASNPYEGAVIVREAPSGEFLTSLESWTGGIVATGRTRRLPDAEWPDAVWDEVRVAGLTGWARGTFLAPIGLTDDITAHLIDRMGRRPEAEQLGELALIVGDAFASMEESARVIIVTRPIVFEALGEVTADVLNIGDDSLLGYRLHIHAVPAGEDWMSEYPGPFTLHTVERTILCQSHRGVTADGLCV